MYLLKVLGDIVKYTFPSQSFHININFLHNSMIPYAIFMMLTGADQDKATVAPSFSFVQYLRDQFCLNLQKIQIIYCLAYNRHSLQYR